MRPRPEIRPTLTPSPRGDPTDAEIRPTLTPSPRNHESGELRPTQSWHGHGARAPSDMGTRRARQRKREVARPPAWPGRVIYSSESSPSFERQRRSVHHRPLNTRVPTQNAPQDHHRRRLLPRGHRGPVRRGDPTDVDAKPAKSRGCIGKSDRRRLRKEIQPRRRGVRWPGQPQNVAGPPRRSHFARHFPQFRVGPRRA